MKPKRFLIATHAPLSGQFGAAQMAINLGEALESLGHSAQLWSPYPIPPTIPPRLRNLYAASTFKSFISSSPPFDIVDLVPLLWTDALRKSSHTVVICRSVQPELLYRFLPAGSAGALGSVTRDKPLGALLSTAQSCLEAVQVLHAWLKVDRILCLGILEFEWMRAKFPFWSSKLSYYRNALSPEEQTLLAHVRAGRRTRLQDGRQGRNYLWIGRWALHKGIARLRDFILERASGAGSETFTIAGCGEGVERFFPANILGRNVFLQPAFERDQLPRLLAEHDAGLFTSEVEGWGLSLNEMLESGMPVFATRAGGVPDLSELMPEMLPPFPPPVDWQPIQPPAEPIYERYYKEFSWLRVCEKLLALAEEVTRNKGLK